MNKPYTNAVSIVNVMVMAKSPWSQVADVFLEGMANNCSLHVHHNHSVRILGVGS